MDRTIFFKKENYKNGKFENIIFNSNMHLELEELKLNGTYESNIINTIYFKDVVASWNGSTFKNSYIEILLQFKTETNLWSEWFSYGKWSNLGCNIGSVRNQKDELGAMYTDQIVVNSEMCAVAFKYKIKFYRESVDIKSPILRENIFTFTAKNSDVADEKYLIEDIDIKVPEKSQMIVPEIGNSICSPTSISMLMAYYGIDQKPENVAANCFDNGARMYGNWSYNVAYAGENGFRAYVKKCNSISELIDIVKTGQPVAASIKTQEQKMIAGSPQAYKYGHLLVLRGLTKDGFVIVNDPASKEVENVKRHYKISEFEKAWSGYIYLIESKMD